MPPNDQRTLAARVRALADPLALEQGLEVLEVDVRGPSGRRLVRITADAADLTSSVGTDVDVLARFSRDLGAHLDEHDPVPGGYTLEVTSPGADRPLRRARDFARNVGREVRIVRRAVDDPRDADDADDAAQAEDRDGPGGLTGTLTAVTDTEITLTSDSDRVIVVPLQDIDHGKVVLPW